MNNPLTKQQDYINMFINSHTTSSMLIPESHNNQGMARDKGNPSCPINAVAIDCLNHMQTTNRPSSHITPFEQNNVHSMDEIESLLNSLNCIDAEFVKGELTKALKLVKQQDYVTAQIMILELALIHESPAAELLTDKLLALIPSEAKKRKYSEISTDELDSENSSCSESDSPSDTESDCPPAKKFKADIIQKLPKDKVQRPPRKRVLTPELIAEAQRRLHTGSRPFEVARELGINYNTFTNAMYAGRIVSLKLNTSH